LSLSSRCCIDNALCKYCA
jgi:hypothetical protein